jgi:hypothetical protein
MKILNSDQEIKDWAEKTPLIPAKYARILHDLEYYDGPIAGILLWNNKNYYFYAFNIPYEVKHHTNRVFAVIEMTKEQEEEEQYWQTQLVERVGFVNGYDINGVSIDSPVKSKTEHEKFWKEYQGKLKNYTLTKDQIKARWFERD